MGIGRQGNPQEYQRTAVPTSCSRAVIYELEEACGIGYDVEVFYRNHDVTIIYNCLL